MTEIETPADAMTADEYAGATRALDTLRVVLGAAQTARVGADYVLASIRRPPLNYIRDYLDEAMLQVANEAREIADAVARFEEDVG